MDSSEPKVTAPSTTENNHVETAPATDATRNVLAEVNDNVTCNSHKDDTKTKKDVAWGGDNDLIDSDDENQGLDPGDKILRDLANAKPEKKKKKKKKSGKKGAVLLDPQTYCRVYYD